MEIDKSNMKKDILEFPKQFRVGLQSAKNIKVSGTFDAVSVCGMGGSALPADILQIWLKAYKIDLPLFVHRNYDLPFQTDQNHLVIPLSYSGNTEETLNAFQEAKNKGFKIACITSGGKLLQLCKKYNFPVALVPKGYLPRIALGFQFSALMKILVNCGIIKNDLENILSLEKLLKPKALQAKGKKLAQKLNGKIPIIYASEKLKELAYVWKLSFNESSKIHAFCNHFPKLNHDELSGWAFPKKELHVIILKDPADHPKILKRIELTAKIIQAKGIGVDIVEIKGKDILYKVFSNILLAYWVSYYLALIYKINPSQRKLNEEFKKRVAK